MRNTYTVTMYEGNDIVAERKFTNKQKATDFAIWYAKSRLAQRGFNDKTIKQIIHSFKLFPILPFTVAVRKS